MTCMPCSYCSFVGFSPIVAKWPLTDMIEGAVGCRVLVEGRGGEDREAMTQEKNIADTRNKLPRVPDSTNQQLKMVVM